MTTTLRDRIEAALPCSGYPQLCHSGAHDKECPAYYRPAIQEAIAESAGDEGLREPEPTDNQMDRFVHHYTDRMKQATDSQCRKTCVVLLEDAQWAADTIRSLRALGQRSSVAWGELELNRVREVLLVLGLRPENCDLLTLSGRTNVARAVLQAAFGEPK